MNTSLGKELKVILFATVLRGGNTNLYLWELEAEVLQNLVFIGMKKQRVIKIKLIKSFLFQSWIIDLLN